MSSKDLISICRDGVDWIANKLGIGRPLEEKIIERALGPSWEVMYSKENRTVYASVGVGLRKTLEVCYKANSDSYTACCSHKVFAGRRPVARMIGPILTVQRRPRYKSVIEPCDEKDMPEPAKIAVGVFRDVLSKSKPGKIDLQNVLQ